MHKGTLLIIIDGIGDVGIERLNGKTPLQAIGHPHLDAVASSGLCGLMDPVEPGLACGSDTAHMSIMGYPPKSLYRGRGAFESLGAGISMQPGDLAFKSNFATLDEETMIVTSRRADRQFEEEGPVLCAALNNITLPSYPHHRVAVKYATEHRCGICISGPHLSDSITGTDPLKDGLPLILCQPSHQNDDPSPQQNGNDANVSDPCYTSTLVNELSTEMRRILTNHPINIEREKKGKPQANVVLLRGAGCMLDVVPFSQQPSGVFKNPFFIAPTCIIAGLGLSLGIEVIKIKGATGDYSTDLLAKANGSIKALTKDFYDFGLLHIKAIDDAGHDQRLDIKLDFICKIDEMLGTIISALKQNEMETGNSFSIAITGDHSTPVEFGDHSCDPVPFAISRVRDIAYDENNISFDEISVARGCLGRFPGSQVMSIMKQIHLGNGSV